MLINTHNNKGKSIVKCISFYQVFRVEDIDQLFEHNDINSNLVILHSKKDINKAKEARIIDDLKRKTV